MQDLITISFPVYNVASTVRKSLLSALSQTYTNIEYLIVDDCGSDDSMEIVEDMVRKSRRQGDVKIVNHPTNKGLGEVRNTSIDNASGKYIYFMDSDDVLASDCIEKLYKTMKKNRVDFVASSYAIVNEKGRIERVESYAKELVFKSNEDIVSYYYRKKGDIYIFMWNKLYSLALIKKHKIRCVHPIVEDDLFLFQVLLHSSSCCLIPDITYYYTINPKSITNVYMKNDISLSVAEIYCGIENYKYSMVERNIFNEELSIYIILAVFTESLFRANVITLSSMISSENKKHMLIEIFSLPDITVSWQIWRRMEYKFKIKLCLYKIFKVMNFRTKVLLLRLLVKVA